MRPREFIALTAASALTFSAQAQPSMRQRRIAVAVPSWDDVRTNPYHAAFFDELGRRGYVEGRNLAVDRYSVRGQMDSYSDLAATVASNRPEVS
jgi:putative ABC transport system substrate-binding protein